MIGSAADHISGPAGDHAPVHARVDATGALTSADAPLLRLNARAGGRLGAPIAVPQIAAIARLARRLRVIVSRAAKAGDGADEIDLWVRAQPDGDALALTITGWTRRPARASATITDPAVARDFARAAFDWLWETDDALRLTALSPAGAAVVGGGARLLIGAPLTRLFSFVEESDGGLPALAAIAEHRRFDGQVAALRAPHAGRYRLGAVPMTDGRGRFAGFRGTAVRIADADADADADLNVDAAPRAGEVPGAAVEDAFASRLDTALRGPLIRIVANADDLQAQNEGPLRSEYAGYATDIAAAGRHLLSLVDDLVDLQAIERPDFRPERDALDLVELAAQAAGLLAVRASAGKVRITRPSVGELPALGEFRRVLQILVNLIGNAVRYSEPSGIVQLVAGRGGGFTSIAVVDRGKGIAPADHARVFEKFERVDPTEPGGTGLGLYIARKLALAMGGDITLESRAGQGARFTLSLPSAEG